MDADRGPARRNRRAIVVTAVTVASLVPLALLAGSGFARSSPSAAQYQYGKVTICHHTHSKKHPFHTITVSSHALKAHLRHGDTLGPCSQTTNAAATHANGKQKGNGSGNGQGHGNGKGNKP
jgi:hypothetical protein